MRQILKIQWKKVIFIENIFLSFKNFRYSIIYVRIFSAFNRWYVAAWFFENLRRLFRIKKIKISIRLNPPFQLAELLISLALATSHWLLRIHRISATHYRRQPKMIERAETALGGDWPFSVVPTGHARACGFKSTLQHRPNALIEDAVRSGDRRNCVI